MLIKQKRGGMLMNGEMHQICMLVNGARNAMAGRKEFGYIADGYINSIRFRFIPGKTFFGEEAREVHSPREWYESCIREGIDDMKFLAPLLVPDRARLGFSNGNQSCILTFHKDGVVTYWTAAWEFDKTLTKWNVVYQEHKWDNPPAEKPRFQDNTAELADILLRIGEFADRTRMPIQLPDMPEEKRRLFYAASMADVFGAMGSWNDEPPYCAHLKGLDETYESLSNELLRQVRLAVLYAVNE